MDKPKSLADLFSQKIFRIPDYQRGYAWQKAQLKDFWEDLINLSGDRKHYTGVLTLREFSPGEISETDNEFWLVDDHSYTMYHIVDGQQRLTSFVVLLQAFIEFVRQFKENADKPDNEIYVTASLSLEDVIGLYLYKTKPMSPQYPTYKFGYTEDNPSYEYLRYKIFNEDGSPSIKETFYTLNLKNAKLYFGQQLKELYSEDGMDGLQEIYKKLTKRFLFNEYVIKGEFDVFVAFETMNNRGKRLSDLELLKNRLIYLTTLYTDEELDDAGRTSLRDAINSAWKEVYHQLGRNDKHPLNDDDFLKAHWIMYFHYSRKKGNDYIRFLLDEQFSPQKVHKKIERAVSLELPEEQPTDSEIDEADGDGDSLDDDADDRTEDAQGTDERTVASLQPIEIKRYVSSLQESAVHWFNSYHPHLAAGLPEEEKDALDRLNRIGMGYFRPLVMSVFKNEKNSAKRVDLLNHIERFIFIVFRLSQARSNNRSSEFYNAAREFNRNELSLDDLKQKLDAAASHCFHEDGSLNSSYFYNYLHKNFNSGSQSGYYGWSWLRYFLYEYELNLLSQNRQKKVAWEDLLKKPSDKISIEHIFPQTPTENWRKLFADVAEEDYSRYSGSIGNLLLLSMAINSSLQNHDFNDKKNPKRNDADVKTRNGYLDGSHSEIEVARCDTWTPAQIKARGLRLLNFMEKRWDIKFKSEEAKKALLFLEKENEDGTA